MSCYSCGSAEIQFTFETDGVCNQTCQQFIGAKISEALKDIIFNIDNTSAVTITDVINLFNGIACKWNWLVLNIILFKYTISLNENILEL